MAIEKMKLVRVLGKTSQIDDFITACCISGDFHPENAMNYVSAHMGYVPLSKENPYVSAIQKIEDLAHISGIVLKETFNGDEIIVEEHETEYIDEIVEDMESLLSRRTPIVTKLEECKENIVKFSHFSNLGISVDEILSCGFLKIRFGSIPIDCYPKLQAYEDNDSFMFFPCVQDEKHYWGVYTASTSRVDEADRIFATLYFERLRIPFEKGTPEEIVETLTEEKKSLEKELAEIDGEVQNFWASRRSRCESIYAHLKILSTAFDLRRYAVKDKRTGSMFLMVGWVPESGFSWFKKRVDELPDTACEVFEAKDEIRSKPPVKLKNKKIFRPFEMFVEMYGLPSYGSVDITPFVAVTFTLLFGLMFADVGQGFVLALGGYLVYKLKGLKIAKIVVPCGISSMCFGFLVGSVFGFEHLLDPVYHALGWEGKPLEVMESINTVLILAIGIGIALVIVSMGLNVFLCFKAKKYGEALFSQNGLAGIVLYLAGVSAVVAFMAKITIIPIPVMIAMAAVSLPVLFMKEILIGKVDHHDKKDYMPESWGDFIMQNFFEVIEYILSYFSNTVSFLRIGAYMLVHAGMMMVFFSLAGDELTVGSVLIIVLGNVIVIALEGLLSGIQVLRLEFYEMFSRFYEGDGKPFEGVGRRKNRGAFFKIKNAFSADKKDDTQVIISVKK
ncbi:MAG: ATPase [Clostridia bacterium]|nr:ATPase [Clostridia bacterium]